MPSRYRVRTLISDLDHPWDVAFRPNGSMFVTEREGWIGLWRNGHYRRILRPAGLVSNGEGGMLGIAVSPRFRRNRRIFVCFNTSRDVRVVRFVFARHPVRLIRRRDIVTGIPANPSGRHSGCRPRFGPDRYLWVTTGDAAHRHQPAEPQLARRQGAPGQRVGPARTRQLPRPDLRLRLPQPAGALVPAS